MGTSVDFSLHVPVHMAGGQGCATQTDAGNSWWVGRRCTIARSYGNCTHGMCRKPCITVSHLPYPTPDPTLKETYFRDIPLVSRDIWNTAIARESLQ